MRSCRMLLSHLLLLTRNHEARGRCVFVYHVLLLDGLSGFWSSNSLALAAISHGTDTRPCFLSILKTAEQRHLQEQFCVGWHSDQKLCTWLRQRKTSDLDNWMPCSVCVVSESLLCFWKYSQQTMLCPVGQYLHPFFFSTLGLPRVPSSKNRGHLRIGQMWYMSIVAAL